MIQKERKYDYLLMCGDVHGQIDVIPYFIKKNGLSNCAVIQCGDFGIGFETEHNENKRMLYLNERLKNSNSDLFALRGNHDKPSYFENEYNQSNLFLLKDYTILNINGINILCIGGATSVDRTKRSGYFNDNKKYNYWKDETVVLDLEKLESIRDISIVCTHTAPDFVTPFTKSNIQNFLSVDEHLADDLYVERQSMNKIYNKLIENNDIKKWYYGHFHMSSKTYIDDTVFILLDCDEITEETIIYEKND